MSRSYRKSVRSNRWVYTSEGKVPLPPKPAWWQVDWAEVIFAVVAALVWAVPIVWALILYLR